MNFFTHQEQAVNRSKQLVLLFVLAVVALIVILNLFVALLLVGVDQASSITTALNAQQWFSISAIVVTGVGGASLWRWYQLRDGGKAVALSMGGRLVHPDSYDFYERRLLNIVEEIALAAGMPVPPVYLIDEQGINAFAAGYNPSDAVIGVTRGTLQKLSREQLQGVVAHEFSHILNGDMRLNIRIMAVLYGILFIGLSGRFLIDIAGSRTARRSSKDNSAAGVAFLGIGMIIIGYCGVFFGKLIKAAVSRQREFLADASAVQFTRNPAGIGGALKVIALEGCGVQNTASEEAAHMFFGQIRQQKLTAHFTSWFATHPSIDERILRIEPNWQGEYLHPQTRDQAENEEVKPLTHEGVMLITAAVAGAGVGIRQRRTAPKIEATPDPIWEELSAVARDAGQAPLLVYALLLSATDSHYHAAQTALLQQGQFGQSLDQVLALQIRVQGLLPQQRLPLVEIAIPALKQMDTTSFKNWRKDLHQLIRVDNKIDIFEWCLYRLLSQYLDAHFLKVVTRVKSPREAEIQAALARVFSTVAHYGHSRAEQVQAAFAAGCESGGFSGLALVPTATPSQLSASLDLLKHTSVPLRGRIVKALNNTVHYDQQLLAVERDLLTTIAAILEVPIAEMALYRAS